MTETPEPDDGTDLEYLDDYLNSDRAPPDCMDLSSLDGFMAGLIVGPMPIPPSEWLPVVWQGEEPSFENDAEAERVLGTILRRYNAIADSLAASPTTFAPIFWEDDEGEPLVSDWAHGFMHAVSLRTESWDVLLNDEDAALLLIPIGMMASLAAEEPDPEMLLPAEDMEELLEDIDMTMIACVIGLQGYWREHPVTPPLRH
jgi:uncharacterized protein